MVNERSKVCQRITVILLKIEITLKYLTVLRIILECKILHYWRVGGLPKAKGVEKIFENISLRNTFSYRVCYNGQQSRGNTASKVICSALKTNKSIIFEKRHN